MRLSSLLNECLNITYNQAGVSANYAVKKLGDTLYLYFQDSKGVNDWLRNIDFPARPYRRMDKPVWFAHRGFAKVWKEIEPNLSKIIADKIIKNIITVGYSHGAAVAVMAHEYIWFNRPDLRESIFGYGFACPRVFWGFRCTKLKLRWKNFLVVRNRGDIVTHLPPFLFGFSHVGKMLKIGKLFKYSIFKAHNAQNIIKELKILENKAITQNVTNKTALI